MDTRVEEYLMKFPRRIIINIMEEAMMRMEQYNGRSVNECMLLALRAEIYDVDFGSIQYVLPPVNQVKKDFDY